MGLDNGFMANGIQEKDIPRYIAYDKYDDNIQFCYMRKCWGIRTEIINVLHGGQNENMSVDAEDIPAIIRIYSKYLHEDYYNDNADSIWTFDEMIGPIVYNIMALHWLQSYMEDHPNVKLTFYDSF